MLLRWDISEPGQVRLLDSVQASEDRQAITSLALVLGDVSLAVGDARGALTTWFPVKVAGSGEDRRLTRIHTLRPNHGAGRRHHPFAARQDPASRWLPRKSMPIT